MTLLQLPNCVKVMTEKQTTLNACTIIMCEEDGYINVTEICKAGKKRLQGLEPISKKVDAFLHRPSNDKTKEFLCVLERVVGIPTVGFPTVDLIKAQAGANGERHTWVHRKVAIHLAQWISPEFAVQVTSWIEEIKKENRELTDRIISIESQRPSLNPNNTFVCQLQCNGQSIPVYMRSDGYIDATALCQAGEKRLNNYTRSADTQAYIKALETSTRISAVDLIKVQAGANSERHTWVHRKSIPVAMRSDGYIDATELCKAGGKLWKNYFQNANTKAYLDVLRSVAGIPATELIQSKQGGTNQGTWVHRKVAIHLAQWISPEFAVQVTSWIKKLEEKVAALELENKELEQRPHNQFKSKGDSILVCNLKAGDKFVPIRMRQDGYINVTSLCKAGGKDIREWKKNKTSTELINTFSAMSRIPIIDILQSVKGGSIDTQGTFAHPDIAIQIAQWVSPEFAIQVSRWTRELLVTGSVTLGQEKSDEEIQKSFRDIIALDLRPYSDKDVLYFGIFEDSDGIELAIDDIPDNAVLFKLGVSSNIDNRETAHAGNKCLDKFKLVRVLDGKSRSAISGAEKYAKRVVREMGMPCIYGKECFMANSEEDLRWAIDAVDEYVRRPAKEENRECMEPRDRMKLKFLELFENDKIDYSQMMEMVEKFLE